MEEKIKALLEVPAPTNVTALKFFLGMVTYYTKFLPNLSTELAPLHKLLKQSVQWQWTAEQQKAFDKAKTLLALSQLL